MNDQDSDEKLMELLPWYVNETLGAHEKMKVEALLKRSETAAAEVALLRQLQESVRKEESVIAPTEMGWRRFQKMLPLQQQPEKSRLSLAKIATIAAVMVIAVQFTLLLNVPEQMDVELLGGETLVQQVSGQQLELKLIFHDQASWQEIQTLLVGIDGEVVAGPSALGMVIVRVPMPEEQASLLRILKESPLIEHVQVIERE